MCKIYFQSVLVLMLFIAAPLVSQNVTIDQGTQRFLGSTSDLDRTKYFTLHSNASDPELDAFFNDYNVTKGRGFWGPYSYAKQQTGSLGTYPAYKPGGTEVRNVSRFISTEHPDGVLRYNLDKVAAANWAVEYWKDFVNDGGRPEFYEPMNEPFVHSTDSIFQVEQPDGNLMRIRMAEWFAEIGKKIDQAPELANMKVIGYSSAWPSMELWDFGHWNSRMKMFMDVAGEHMDAFSTHLYDGINVTGQDNFRSGSNSEAILDLIEAYSHIKFGFIKDHAITEYGGIAKGYGPTYTDVESAQTVKSFNNIIFNLLEREDKMAISIPFATDKSEWFIKENKDEPEKSYQPYGAVLLRPTNLGEPVPAGWVYTPKVYFYDLWKEFKGKRVAIDSDNPDVQVQAFVSGKKMYVALNNLDTSSKTIGLNFKDVFSGLQNVRIKRVKVYDSQNPVFTNTLQTTAPSSMTLIGGETVTLEYTFSNNLSFDNAIRSKKYYTSKYLQPILGGTAMSFSFNGVATGTGKAVLRMSIGRKHSVSKLPTVKVNGTTVAVPSNWKGYDQATREDFFGTIEIPVPMSLIKINNTISVKFPDSGGHLSSLILQVEKYDNAISNEQTAYPGGTPHAIPGTVLSKNYDNGGEGVAYHDADAAQKGVPFRTTEGVDVVNGDGGQVVGWTVNNEWQEYTINVANTGDYILSLRYSAPAAGGSIYVAFNGENKTDTMVLPATNNWNTYNNVTKTIKLSEGLQVMRVYTVSAGINLSKIDFTFQEPVQEPYGGTNRSIPGTIEGEHYDVGEEGVAFHETTAANLGNSSFRNTEPVDLVYGDGGTVIGWVEPYEWVEYSVNTTGGTYSLEARVSAPTAGKSIVAQIDGTTIATIAVPNTNNWNTYATVTVNNIPLATKSNRVLRLEFPQGGLNLNWVKFSSSSLRSASLEEDISLNETERNIEVYPNPFTNNITVNLSGNHEFQTVHLLDIHGKKLASKSVVDKEQVLFNNDGLIKAPKGIYFIQLIGQGSSKTMKILKR